MQVVPVGRPEQLKLTVPAYPPTGVNVKVAVAEWPATTVMFEGFTVSVYPAPMLKEQFVIPTSPTESVTFR